MNFPSEESTIGLTDGKSWFKIIANILEIENNSLLNYWWINCILLKRKSFRIEPNDLVSEDLPIYSPHRKFTTYFSNQQNEYYPNWKQTKSYIFSMLHYINTNNFYTVIWIQVFLSNTFVFQTDILSLGKVRKLANLKDIHLMFCLLFCFVLFLFLFFIYQ